MLSINKHPQHFDISVLFLSFFNLTCMETVSLCACLLVVITLSFCKSVMFLLVKRAAAKGSPN